MRRKFINLIRVLLDKRVLAFKPHWFVQLTTSAWRASFQLTQLVPYLHDLRLETDVTESTRQTSIEDSFITICAAFKNSFSM